MNVKSGEATALDAREDAGITLELLKAVDGKADQTQRTLANHLGIALGLVNTYLKRCVNKGYIKIRQVPRNRYAYYLTPQGFAAKSKLAAEYLYQSLSLFRQARDDYWQIFAQCAETGRTRVCLCGCSDLTDIALLLSSEFKLEMVGIYDPKNAGSSYHGHVIADNFDALKQVDAWIVTGLVDAQTVFDDLASRIGAEAILVPDFLGLRTAPVPDGLP